MACEFFFVWIRGSQLSSAQILRLTYITQVLLSEPNGSTLVWARLPFLWGLETLQSHVSFFPVSRCPWVLVLTQCRSSIGPQQLELPPVSALRNSLYMGLTWTGVMCYLFSEISFLLKSSFYQTSNFPKILKSISVVVTFMHLNHQLSYFLVRRRLLFWAQKKTFLRKKHLFLSGTFLWPHATSPREKS